MNNHICFPVPVFIERKGCCAPAFDGFACHICLQPWEPELPKILPIPGMDTLHSAAAVPLPSYQ